MPQNHFFNISKTKYRGTIATSSANKQKHKISTTNIRLIIKTKPPLAMDAERV